MILGGMGTLLGPVIGSFIIILLIELSSTLLGASGGTQVLYGLALVLIYAPAPDRSHHVVHGRARRGRKDMRRGAA